MMRYDNDMKVQAYFFATKIEIGGVMLEALLTDCNGFLEKKSIIFAWFSGY